MQDELTPVTIDRAKWGRGLLWNPNEDCGCALGHCLRALGVSEDNLCWLTLPDEVDALPVLAVNSLLALSIGGHYWLTSPDAEKVSDINDDTDMVRRADEREAAITEACRAIGFAVTWEGEYR